MKPNITSKFEVIDFHELLHYLTTSNKFKVKIYMNFFLLSSLLIYIYYTRTRLVHWTKTQFTLLIMHIYYLKNTFSCLYIKVLYYTVTDTKIRGLFCLHSLLVYFNNATCSCHNAAKLSMIHKIVHLATL